MEKRIAVVGIMVRLDEQPMMKINEILSRYSANILGRQGVPRREKGFAVISLIIEGTTDEIGALTGKLGNIHGVKVKSAITA